MNERERSRAGDGESQRGRAFLLFPRALGKKLKKFLSVIRFCFRKGDAGWNMGAAGSIRLYSAQQDAGKF